MKTIIKDTHSALKHAGKILYLIEEHLISDERLYYGGSDVCV